MRFMKIFQNGCSSQHIRDIRNSIPGLVRDHVLHQFLPPEDTEQLFWNNKSYNHRRCSLPPTVINITAPAMETKVKPNLRKLRKLCWKTFTLQLVLMFLFVLFLMYFIKEDQWLQQDSRREGLKSTEIKTTQPPYVYQKPFLISSEQMKSKPSKFTMFPPLNHLSEEPKFPVIRYYEEHKFPMPPKLERYPPTLNHFDKEPKFLWKPGHGFQRRAKFVDNQLIDSEVQTTICNSFICNYWRARDTQAGQNGVEKSDPGSSGSSR